MATRRVMHLRSRTYSDFQPGRIIIQAGHNGNEAHRPGGIMQQLVYVHHHCRRNLGNERGVCLKAAAAWAEREEFPHCAKALICEQERQRIPAAGAVEQILWTICSTCPPKPPPSRRQSTSSRTSHLRLLLLQSNSGRLFVFVRWLSRCPGMAARRVMPLRSRAYSDFRPGQIIIQAGHNDNKAHRPGGIMQQLMYVHHHC
jgi:hypothetical protein